MENDNPTSSGETKTKLTRHPERVSRIPKDITPCASAAFGIFEMLTEGSDRWEQATAWIRLAAEIGPIQYNFTKEDWQRMINMVVEMVNEEAK